MPDVNVKTIVSAIGKIKNFEILYNKNGIKNKNVNIPTEYPIIFFIILRIVLL